MAGTAAGTAVENRAQLRWTDGDGNDYDLTSPPAIVVVGQVAGVDIQPPLTLEVSPGEEVRLRHTLTNTGNGPDCLLPTATSPDGLVLRVYRAAADGSPTGPEITACLPLAADASLDVVVVVQVPPTAAPGSSFTVQAAVTSDLDPAVTDVVADLLEVPAGTMSLQVEKSVDREEATLGDTLTYSVAYAASGGSEVVVVISDAIPAGTAYLPGSLLVNGVPATDADDGDPGRYDAGLVVFELVLSSGDSGSVSFAVTVQTAEPSGTIDNVAAVSHAGSGGTVEQSSNGVATPLVAPALYLEKTLEGPSPAGLDEEVVFTLRLGNSAERAAARGATLVDSLPPALEYVASVPPADVEGRQLRWALGDLVPGASREIQLTVRVAEATADTAVVWNRAWLEAANGPAVRDSAEVLLVGAVGAELAIDKRADVLEAAVGETVGFTIGIENTGSTPLADLAVSDTLPRETRYVPGSASGVDSVAVDGRVLTFFLEDPLTPGASCTVRYSVALISGAAGVLRNVAVATAEGGFVRSAAVSAFVQTRDAWPLETRVAMGRVWVDVDGDGSLDAGEPGVEGVDVWTEDGQVATTDEDGKFSFRNLRPGGHAFHLDGATLPAAMRTADPQGDLVTLTADGWTSPRVNFRLLPRGARLAAIRPVPVGREAGDAESTGRPSAPVDDPGPPGPSADPASSGGPTTPGFPAVDPVPAGNPTAGGQSGGPAPAGASSGAKARGVAAADVPWPDTLAAPGASTVEAVLQPSATGWPEVTFTPPPGWSPVPGSSRLGRRPVPDPEVRRDRSGARVLFWRFADEPGAQPLTLRLTTGAPSSTRAAPTVPALRSPEDRQTSKRNALFAGPGPEIFGLADGVVLPRDVVFIGVRGEPGRPVALFDGDSLVAEAETRPDGVHDFLAVKLAPGPHRLRVRILNSWGQLRWDSLSVHVTAPAARFELQGSPLQLVADGNTLGEMKVVVVDRWGVPVLSRPFVTVWAEGATPADRDEDPKAAGTQLRPDDAGWLTVRLRPGKTAGRGVLGLRTGPVERRVPIEVLPELRSLIVTGLGRVGVGASPNAFASITARGKLDSRTSITLSYDSRKLDDGRGFFGRGFDPLEASRYPIFGDASQRRTLGSAQGTFTGRLERGLDWLALGELTTHEFSEGLRLSRYNRSLSGAAARLATGPVTWRAFGSLTSQSLQQQQIRGEGTSGPYQLAQNVRRGTELVLIETRDAFNAEAVLARQPLARFVDYQIDYERGVLLLKRPVPAADGFGNPVFLMVTYEADAGGERQLVAGLRATIDVLGDGSAAASPAPIAPSPVAPHAPVAVSSRPSVRLGLTGVHGGGEARRHYLGGVDLSARAAGLALEAELSYSSLPDSADVALALGGTVGLVDGKADVAASWTRVGSRYVNPSNLSLRPGTEDIRLGAGWRLGPESELRVGHQRQFFRTEGVTRNQTFARLSRSLGSDVRLSANFSNDHFRNSAGLDESLGGELRVDWRAHRQLSLFAEGRRQFQYTGRNVMPDHVGVGAEYRLLEGVHLEARHRRVFLDTDSTSYSVTNLGLRSDIGFGTQIWSSYQLAGGTDPAHNAAVIGLNNQVRLGSAWTINSLFERRIGIDRAPAENPVRALPFLQQEEDYWAASLGVELLPAESPYRLAARGQYRDGEFRSMRLVTVAGDLSISRSLALLSRQDYLESEEHSTSRPGLSRRRASLWGVAFRPTDTDVLNLLTKFEYVDELNPRGVGVLAQEGRERRLIAVAEAVWALDSRLELAARYATRLTDSRLPAEDGGLREVASRADYVGARTRLELGPWASLAVDGRLLVERQTSATRWDAAPSLFVHPFDLLEVEVGYRFGDLTDPDFSVHGGHGWFLTFGARLTRRTVGSAAEFWRARF